MKEQQIKELLIEEPVENLNHSSDLEEDDDDDDDSLILIDKLKKSELNASFSKEMNETLIKMNSITSKNTHRNVALTNSRACSIQ
jgi:hypothetical protein